MKIDSSLAYIDTSKFSPLRGPCRINLPVATKIFLTAVVDSFPREIRKSDRCPPPREEMMRAKGGREEASPVCPNNGK